MARKNGGPLAEQAGETRPDGMQRLRSLAVWDEDGVRDELRKYVLERLGAEHAIAAIDETSFRQQRRQVGGSGTAIVWEQQPGRKLEAWGCFCPPLARLRHTLLDRELYLPRHWLEDRARCEEAGIVFHRAFSDEV